MLPLSSETAVTSKASVPVKTMMAFPATVLPGKVATFPLFVPSVCIYLEAIESVLANSSKLLMGVTPGDNDGGDGNTNKYLPLDKRVAPRGAQ